MSVCFDFRSTNVVQLSSRTPYFYQFRCHHPVITQLRNHTYLIFSSLIIIFGNLLVAFFHTQITIVLNRQDHIISYSLLRYVDNSIISFHHHKIVQIWLTTMLKSLWFDLINFLVSWLFFLVSLVIFVLFFGTFEQLVTPPILSVT